LGERRSSRTRGLRRSSRFSEGRTAFAAEFELRQVLGATVRANGLERRTAAAAEFSVLRILGIAP
jgi:hypothetical protein